MGKHKHSSKNSPKKASIESGELIRALENKRLQDYLDRKKLKEAIKATETPEEKRIRRLKEKEAKEIRRRQRMGWDTEYERYSNQDNPFGDPNLMSSFVWTKKLEKEGFRAADLETVEVLSRQKQIDNKIELQKVKKRRMERELERQAREEEMQLMQRSREAAQFKEWERQEDQFHLEQAKLRSVIRIQDGRAKPIDLLAQYINSNLDDSIEMQMHEPYNLLNGLNIKDLEDLIEDIKVYIEMEKGNNIDFWNDMIVIAEDELKKLRKQELDGKIHAEIGRREGIHQNVVKDVCDIFKGKTSAQLNELQCRIENKILQKSDGVDISYWESLLSQLKAHLARARLLDRHQEILKKKLLSLKQTQSGNEDLEEPTPDTSSDVVNSGPNCNSDRCLPDDTPNFETDRETCYQLYESGGYSPKYISFEDIGDNVVLSEDQDAKEIQFARDLILKSKLNANKGSHEPCEVVENEADFSIETPLSAQFNFATDKYRPRKPRYFNRVHTGFEWNKYNQTHYDMDNPPPKIVQGYKFNIFYPDLIDKTSTPQYHLTPCEDNADFSILRFHAGPPYEDIAFKIVNREWEFSYKKGFRCQFHNNIFQLWFHFKRYRYRR